MSYQDYDMTSRNVFIWWALRMHPHCKKNRCGSECLSGSSQIYFQNYLDFWSRRSCVRHTWWRTKRSWPLFTYFFLLSFSLPSTFHPLHGISRAWKFVSPNILAKLEDPNFFKFWVIFYEKKLIFDRFSAFCGQHLVTAAWATRSP